MLYQRLKRISPNKSERIYIYKLKCPQIPLVVVINTDSVGVNFVVLSQFENLFILASYQSITFILDLNIAHAIYI